MVSVVAVRYAKALGDVVVLGDGLDAGEFSRNYAPFMH